MSFRAKTTKKKGKKMRFRSKTTSKAGQTFQHVQPRSGPLPPQAFRLCAWTQRHAHDPSTPVAVARGVGARCARPGDRHCHLCFCVHAIDPRCGHWPTNVAMGKSTQTSQKRKKKKNSCRAPAGPRPRTAACARARSSTTHALPRTRLAPWRARRAARARRSCVCNHVLCWGPRAQHGRGGTRAAPGAAWRRCAGTPGPRHALRPRRTPSPAACLAAAPASALPAASRSHGHKSISHGSRTRPRTRAIGPRCGG